MQGGGQSALRCSHGKGNRAGLGPETAFSSGFVRNQGRDVEQVSTAVRGSVYSRGLLVRNPLCKGRKGVLWLKLAGDTEGWHSLLLSPF